MTPKALRFLLFLCSCFVTQTLGAQNAPPPKIKALVKYVIGSRELGCPYATANSTFTALSDKTLELKNRLSTFTDDLDDLPGIGLEAKNQITAWNEAVKNANNAAGQEKTICDAADALANLPASPLAYSVSATSDTEVLIDQTALQFPSTEANVAASEMQFSISNADATKKIALVGEPRVVVTQDECDATEQEQDPAKCAHKHLTTTDIESKSFKVTQLTGTCTSAMSTGQNCQVHIGFTPEHAGKLNARVVFNVAVNGVPRGKVVLLSGEGEVKNVATFNGDGIGGNNPSVRLLAGLDISGSTNSQVQQKYYLEAALNAPIGWSKTRRDALNRGYWWFFNPRITSLPRPPTAFSNLNVQGFTDFFNNSNNKTDLVQGLDVQGGVEACPNWLKYLCARPREGIPFFTSYKNMHARIGIYWVAGTGFTTPFASQVNNPTVFSLADSNGMFPGATGYTNFTIPNPNFNPNNCDSLTNSPQKPCPGGNPSTFSSSTDPKFAGKQGFAFVLDDRSRFYRKFFVGLRLKTYHFTDLAQGTCDDEWVKTKTGTRTCEGVYNDYPGVIDLTAAKDEQVTGGHISTWIFRMDANYPLPFAPYIHVLASVNSSFRKNITSAPFIPPATSTLSLGSPMVGIVNVSRFPDRDLYRIGVGIDLLKIKDAISNKNTPAAQTTPEKATQTAQSNTATQAASKKNPPAAQQAPDTPK